MQYEKKVIPDMMIQYIMLWVPVAAISVPSAAAAGYIFPATTAMASCQYAYISYFDKLSVFITGKSAPK